jgi:hypothetical protein
MRAEAVPCGSPFRQASMRRPKTGLQLLQQGRDGHDRQRSR